VVKWCGGWVSERSLIHWLCNILTVKRRYLNDSFCLDTALAPHPLIYIQRRFQSAPTTCSKCLFVKRSKSGLSVLDKHLKVSLVPGTSLRRRLESVVLATERVVAGSRGITRTVRLTTGLNPDERVDERRAGVGGRADTETGAVDVAPVTPLEAQTGDAVAGSVDDGLAGHTGGLELRRDELDEQLLVLGLVPLGVGGFGELAGRLVPRVPAGDVGGNTADLLGAAGVLVNGGELLGTGLCGCGQYSYGNWKGLGDVLRLSFQPSHPPWPASMYMATLGKLSCLRAYATPSR
jgi:hypothetical protein